MNLWTPTFFVRAHSPDDLEQFLIEEYSRMMKPEDYLGGLMAMIPHDIFKSVSSPEEIENIIKADMLIISAKQDHLVNPISSIELSKKINAKLVTLDTDCGHLAVGCETEKIRQEITSFLNDK